MNYSELDKLLKEYTEDELYYRDYYAAKQSPDTYKEFIEKFDVEYIKSRLLIIPEVDIGVDFSYFWEDNLFSSKKDNNLFTTKHHRYTPEFTHKHSFFEMSYVYSGSLRQNISGDEVVLNQGDICILPPDVEHSVGIFDDAILINFLIRRSTFNDTFLEVLSEENILSSFFTRILHTKSYNNYIIFRTCNNSAIRRILCDIVIEDMEKKKYSNKVLDNLIMVFFSYLLRDETIKVELPQELKKSNKQLTAILSYIQGNYKTVTLEELSKKFHFSIPYLSKLIKANTGHSFKEMLQTIKLNKAVELLCSSDLKINAISEAVGYENTTHFIRTFKKVYGISPNQYRQQKKFTDF
jgi:AraC-like DNA-binding protein/mannose-6-phosphate isomerase-like protein (cupin superfamily)